MFIEDAVSGKRAEVNSRQQVSARAISEPVLSRVSSKEGLSFIWTSQDLDIDAADTLLLVRNDSSNPLYIDYIILSSGNVATRYEIHVVTASFTIAGTTVTGFCLNTALNKVAEATAASDETGNTQGTVIYDVSLLATTTFILPTTGLVLGTNISLGIDQVTESTAGNASIIGHYEP